MSRSKCLLLSAFLSMTAFASVAQSPSPAEIDPKSLNRPLATWNQAERDFGFANWDRTFPARRIPRGQKVHPLPDGASLPTFSEGGVGAMQLQRNIEAFQLAGLVVLQDGKLRLERYARGHSAAGRWISFSVTKSLTSTLVGAAIKDGFISGVDDLVTRYIPELEGSSYDKVTLRQLLTMTSGTQWNEDYASPEADITRFYFAAVDPGMDATVSYMRKLRRDTPPGQKWNYNTGDTNLLGVVVARATKKNLASYASEKIWARYGMEQDAFWMVDRTSNEHGGCCVHASTRDLARFGQLMLDGTHIDGQAIVSDGWLEAATRKQVDRGDPVISYGFQWWTRGDGSFNALGTHGQHVHVDPRRRMVIVVNSASPSADFTPESLAGRTALFNAIRAALDSEARGDSQR
jgi:CubicO group peptidase (beta-lactamase class C family)